MAMDTFYAFAGTYDDVDDAVADYDAIKDAHVALGIVDAYDAAVIERKGHGKVKVVKKHETPTRAGGVMGGGLGLGEAALLRIDLTRRALPAVGVRSSA